MSMDIGGDLEKTSSREKYINQQLDGLINELRNSHDKLAKAKVLKKIIKIFLKYYLIRKHTQAKRRALPRKPHAWARSIWS